MKIITKNFHFSFKLIFPYCMYITSCAYVYRRKNNIYVQKSRLSFVDIKYKKVLLYSECSLYIEYRFPTNFLFCNMFPLYCFILFQRFCNFHVFLYIQNIHVFNLGKCFFFGSFFEF